MLRQWCCSAAENKQPLNPATLQPASVVEPATWGTYDQAKKSGLPNIGFVLTGNDPYTIIDLDKPINADQELRHSKIVKKFRSYAELSLSGKGVHIIVKGDVPAGARHDNIEIYPRSRYMICTGNRINKFPISEQNERLNALYSEIISQQPVRQTASLHEKPEISNDEAVLKMAVSATNAEKFNKLYGGEWENDYPSQSEADFALISILAFYSPSNSQVRRLFKTSALGQRKKATPTYINRCLKRIRIPDIKIDLKTVKEKKLPTLSYPPNLTGEIAEYIYSSAARPIKEVAITAALALMSGICGRAWNISKTGLNQYLIILAPTGSGKEGASDGIQDIIAAVKETFLTADTIFGPSAFASGQGLIRALDNNQVFLSILGEFGLTLQQICDSRANSALIMLKKVLLDLYAKSGHGKILYPSVYSDTAKNTAAVASPAVTLLAESTPETFFEKLGTQHIAEGLLPRFTIIEYEGKRPPLNKDRGGDPSPSLIEKIKELLESAFAMKENHKCVTIKISTEAQEIIDAFDIFCDGKINNGNNELERQLWNRAHLKVLKLSGLLAVGKDFHSPEVSVKDAEWALTFVTRDVETMLKRFRSGRFGTGNTRQAGEVIRLIKAYIVMPKKERCKSYMKIPKALHDEPKIVPYTFLRRRAMNLSVFKSDRLGETFALKKCLDELITSGILAPIIPMFHETLYKLKTPLYTPGEHWNEETNE